MGCIRVCGELECEKGVNVGARMGMCVGVCGCAVMWMGVWVCMS